MMPHMDAREAMQQAGFEIREVCKASRLPDWGNGQQALSHHIILYAARGKGEVLANGRPLRLERDAVFVQSPGSRLEIRPDPASPLLLYWVVFDWFARSLQTQDRLEYIRQMTFPVTGKLHMKNGECKRLLYLLADEGLEAGGRRRFHSQQLLSDLLEGLLSSVHEGTRNDAGGKVMTTVDYMLHHYREPLRIGNLAELGGFHPAYYSQAFKQVMGKTPMDYLTDLRMNKAKEILLTTDKAVSDVAALVGYGDEFYFSRRFKEKSGFSPSIFTGKKEMKLVSLSSPYTDHLVTLGLTPQAAQVHRHIRLETRRLTIPEHGTDPWHTERKIFIELQPDLVICKDNVLLKAQEHINDIAPIIAIPWKSKDIYQHLLEIAGLVDRDHLARQWVDGHEKKAEVWRNKLRHSLGNAAVALCVCRENELRMYGARNIGHVFYRSLGLTPPEAIQRKMESHPPGTGFTWTAISPDELGQYEADVLCIAVEKPADRQRVLHWQKTNPAWFRHPAFRGGRVLFLDWEKWLVYAPCGIDQQLDEAGRLLAGF